MKKLFLGAIAASILALPVTVTPASAEPQRKTETRLQVGPNRTVVTKRTVTRQPQNRRWAKGQRFDRRYAQNYREVPNWQQYRNRRLYAPPRGYHWVRSGNDAVLVAIAGGAIGAVLAGAFN